MFGGVIFSIIIFFVGKSVFGFGVFVGVLFGGGFFG